MIDKQRQLSKINSNLNLKKRCFRGGWRLILPVSQLDFSSRETDYLSFRVCGLEIHSPRTTCAGELLVLWHQQSSNIKVSCKYLLISKTLVWNENTPELHCIGISTEKVQIKKSVICSHLCNLNSFIVLSTITEEIKDHWGFFNQAFLAFIFFFSNSNTYNMKKIQHCDREDRNFMRLVCPHTEIIYIQH